MKLSSAAIAILSACALPAWGQVHPATPIEHLVVIIGENVSFDTMFAAYQPPHGQTVSNLLSKKIINADGSPGPNYREAVQKIPKVRGGYQVDYPEGTPYPALPRPYAKAAQGEGREIDTVLPADLPPGPYPITRYRSYTERTDSNPVHRFFQMWQQVNAGRNDLFVWTSMTSGEGSANKRDPSTATEQSSEGMGFYNMSKGDLPYFNTLARTYTLADNHHQSIMGGTMPNYFALATGGDVVRYLKDGVTAVPPQNQIENPEPVAGTANWFTQSGYGDGSYTACADATQPGVGAIRKYLATLPYPVFNHGNCEAGTYYLVNNYSAPYTYSGVKNPVEPDNYVAPPQTTPTIAGALSAKGISWRWYNRLRDSARLQHRTPALGNTGCPGGVCANRRREDSGQPGFAGGCTAVEVG